MVGLVVGFQYGDVSHDEMYLFVILIRHPQRNVFYTATNNRLIEKETRT